MCPGLTLVPQEQNIPGTPHPRGAQKHPNQFPKPPQLTPLSGGAAQLLTE